MHGRASGTAQEDHAGGHRARLRKRLLETGPEGFHDYELIEYLLALTIPRVDTKPLAKRLIHDFGGIGPLLSASADALRNEGLTDPTIAALKIGSSSSIVGRSMPIRSASQIASTSSRYDASDVSGTRYARSPE